MAGRPRKNPAHTNAQRMADRSATNKGAHAVARLPDEVKQAFVMGNWEIALAGLSEAITRKEAWVLRAWLEASGAIQSPTIQIALHQFIADKLGVRDESEAVALVEQGKRLKQMSESGSESHEQFLADLEDAIRQLLRERPDMRGALARCVNEGSHAEVET